MSMVRVFSCVVGRGCLLWPVHSLDKTLLAFALLPFVLQGKTCLLLQVSLYFLHLHSSPLWWKEHLLGMLVLEGLVGHHRTVSFSYFSITGRGIDLDYCDVECLSWERTEIILSCLRLHPSTAFWTLLLTMMATPFLLKGFLPTVVDKMVIWVKFTFQSILVCWFLKCRCSLLPSPVWPLPICPDSWT